MSQDLSSSVRWWHLAACAVHLVSFVVLAMLDQPKTFPGDIGPYSYAYACANATGCDVSDSLASAYVTSTPQQGVLANEFITAMSHAIGVAVAWSYKERRPLESWRRWTEYAVTAGILECSILFGFGVRDFFVFVLVFALNAALQYTGGLSLDQIQNSEDNALYKAQKPILLVQSFVFLLVQIWFTITTAANAETDTLGSEIVTSSVLYAVFYASFGVLQTLKHTVVDFEQRYDADVGFIVLSVTSKLCLSYHAVSIQKQIEQSLSDAPDTLSNTVDQLRAAVTALYVVSAVAVGLYAVWPQMCKKDNRYDDL